MIKNLILTLLFLPSAFSAMAQAPKAKIIEQVKNAGTHPRGEKITEEFLIRNDGDTTLNIIYVRPSCSCLVPDFDKTIAPGKTGKITVLMDLTNKSGPVSYALLVRTNDPATPSIQLSLSATVK
jgi:hypothetical protein